MDTAFSGFTKRFLHLFLGGFVAWMLTIIGYLFLIIPGVYLMVAWIFALPLIIDKQIDFWPAMELSRKVVTRHWWKFLGFCLVLDLLVLAGVLACGIGVFVTMPIAIAALMYAYEDILGDSRQTLRVPLGGVGPSGTMAMPNTPLKPASAPVGNPEAEPGFRLRIHFLWDYGSGGEAIVPSTPTLQPASQAPAGLIVAAHPPLKSSKHAPGQNFGGGGIFDADWQLRRGVETLPLVLESQSGGLSPVVRGPRFGTADELG